MRRFLTLVCLLGLSIPAGITFTGCTRNPGENYCNGKGYGPKVTDVYAISMSPTSGSLSLAYGQTRQASSPSATTCKNSSASVSSFTYGTSNQSIIDISPTGNMCAGTWNRNSGGGIPDYTKCSAPTTEATTNALPYASATITASAMGVTSNPVTVYVHAPVTSLNLVGPTACLSQGTTYSNPLDVIGYYNYSGNHIASGCTANADGSYSCPICAPASSGLLGPDGSALPVCANSIGTLTYSIGTSSVATLNSTTNQITAQLPGTTLITATVAGTSSSAGYFTTCPPASISVTLANGSTSGTITKGVTQNMVTTVLDTQGKQLTGLSLDYQSTALENISVSSSGQISATYPGSASIYAVCQPSTCNPAPINMLGYFGTGLSVTSNPVTVTVPGTASEYVWYGAPGQSQYIVPVDMLTQSVGSAVKLPYVPNSMKMDRNGTNLYLGSSVELMVYTAGSNAVTKTDTSAPGVVLAVAPDNSMILINDQVRGYFYLYSPSSGITSRFSGLGAAAAWTPDAKTLYIADSKELNYTPENVAAGITSHTDTLYVYSSSTGWSTYSLPGAAASVATCQASDSASCARSLAVTMPGVGAYISGLTTVSHTWCPSGAVGGTLATYPLADKLDTVSSDILASTNDGAHILGAALSTSGITTFIDQPVAQSQEMCPGVSATGPALGGTLSPLTTANGTAASVPVTGINATNLNQILVAPDSSKAFLTYTGTTAGAKLPYYIPSTGKLNYLSLTEANSSAPVITAPLAGVFSPDNTILFLSTSGDNLVHYINVTGTTPVDGASPVNLKLPSCLPVAQGGVDVGCKYQGANAGTAYVPATVITVKPRATT